MADSKLIPAAVGGIGALFLWSALKGKSILSATQATIQGKNPKFAAATPGLNSGVAPSGFQGNPSFATNIRGPVNSSQRAWIVAVLLGIGAPPTKANIDSLVAWGNHESVWPGGPNMGGTYNLFNTTLSMPGATDYNSVGVKNYPTATVGVAATVATLLESNYNDVTAALRTGRGLCGQSFQGLSTWSGGGYSEVC